MEDLNDNPERNIPLTHIRPRFIIETELSPSVIMERLKDGLRQPSSPIIGQAAPRYANFMIHETISHYWSPRLTLTIEEEEDVTIIRGLFGPRPTVWTMLMFFYSAVGFSIIVVGGIGMSLITMGDDAPVLWAIPFLTLVLLSIYVVAYLGKKKGHEQMILLYHFFKDSTGLEIEED